MRDFRIVLLCLCTVLLIAGCERRVIEDEYRPFANLKIAIDWTLAGFDPDNDPNQNVYGASAWFFPKDGANAGRAIEFKLENPRGQTVQLPVGHYSVLIFNNTVSDYSTIGFRGTEAYNTFEAYALTVKGKSSKQLYVPTTGSSIVEPELLAAWHLDEFEVKLPPSTGTCDPNNPTNNPSLNAVTNLDAVQPTLLIYTTRVIAHVNGLNNAKSATGILTGLASSVFLSSGLNNPPAINQPFAFTSRTYNPGSSTNGYIETLFRTFGPIANAPTAQYGLEIDFVLKNDKANGPYNYNVTNQVLQSIVKASTVILNIKIEVGVDHTSDDPVIVLPIVDTGDGGFNIGLTDWGPEINIPTNM